MQKNFQGFDLVEAYHSLKSEKRFSKRAVTIIKLLVAVAVLVTLWILPAGAYGIEGLTIIEKRTIAIFVFATIMWVMEAVPA